MPDDDKEPSTKADLREVQAGIRQLDQKIEVSVQRLDQKIDRVAAELVRTQADVREIKETMATKNDVSRILNAIDSFARKSEIYDRAATIHGQTLVEVEVKLKDHEKRLDTIESARS